MNVNNTKCLLNKDTGLLEEKSNLTEILEHVAFGINSIIQVFPKLTNETYKKIDLRFIKQLTDEIDKIILKI